MQLQEIEQLKEKAAVVLNTDKNNILMKYNSGDTGRYARGVTRIDPCIIDTRLQGLYTSTYSGMTLLETRQKNPVRFIIARVLSPNGDMCVSYLFCAKGDLFKIEKFNRRYHPLNSKTIVPIIETRQLQEIMSHTVGFYKKRRKMKNYGVNISKGLLFQGTPGNGKSLMCAHIQQQMRVPIVRYFAKDLENPDVHFNNTLTIVDDIDIGHLNRRDNSSLCCSLLSKLDNGFLYDNINIRIITTNEDVRDSIDPAFFRPGRIDKTFYFNNPTRAQRKEVIVRWKLDVSRYAKYTLDHTEYFSFAEMQGLYTNLIIQKEIEEKEQLDIELAIQQIIDNRDKVKKDTNMGFQEE